MNCEVLKAMKTSVMVFWVMTPCRLVDGHQHFDENNWPHPQPYKSTRRHNAKDHHAHGELLLIIDRRFGYTQAQEAS
jgi:hypothetical protein